MRYLTQLEYQERLLDVLTRLGLCAKCARHLIAERWPMHGLMVPTEALGRGLIVTRHDVEDWLRHVRGGKTTWDDGSAVTAETAWFSPRLVDDFLQWAVATGRAKPLAAGEMVHFSTLNALMQPLP